MQLQWTSWFYLIKNLDNLFQVLGHNLLKFITRSNYQGIPLPNVKLLIKQVTSVAQSFLLGLDRREFISNFERNNPGRIKGHNSSNHQKIKKKIPTKHCPVQVLFCGGKDFFWDADMLILFFNLKIEVEWNSDDNILTSPITKLNFWRDFFLSIGEC